MEKFMDLLEFNAAEQKRRMGRPPKVPPFSHYDAYKKADVEFFISLFSRREELYNPCEEFSEFRQRAFHFIEKKCSHFLAMRKGRNAEKLWLYLFNDFEKLMRNGGDKNDERNKSIAVFYDSMKFLIPYLEKSDKINLPNMPRATLHIASDSAQERPKRSKLELEFPDNQLDDDWLQKVIETVTNPQSVSTVSNTTLSSVQAEASEQKMSKSELFSKPENLSTSEKHADILSCVTTFLEEVPKEKLMLCKVNLFQFIEEEKKRLRSGK